MTIFSSKFRQRIFRHRAEDLLPHVVTHQRVYIVPTRRGAAFLLSLLLMLVAAINYSLSLGYALCFLLTGLFAATLLHTYRNLAGLQLIGIHCSDGFAGDSMAVTLRLANPAAQVRHGIRISTEDGITTTVRIKAGQDEVANLALPVSTRGVHWLGRLTLQSDWPLGLWTSWSYLHAPVKALVYPMPERNPPPLPATQQQCSGPGAQPDRQGDVAGLRHYVAGDSIGSIAWKSAARGQGLQVRLFDTDSGPSQTELSLQHTGMRHPEEQLSRLCAWVLSAERSGTDYSLQLPGEHCTAGHGHEQRLRALRALALHGNAT
ncbi:MAG: DUF58 domain-containing protein [Granulosicoccus sp.]|nr:DUF58 domain-containing protein [Granulosicoccus sp.]